MSLMGEGGVGGGKHTHTHTRTHRRELTISGERHVRKTRRKLNEKGKKKKKIEKRTKRDNTGYFGTDVQTYARCKKVTFFNGAGV